MAVGLGSNHVAYGAFFVGFGVLIALAVEVVRRRGSARAPIPYVSERVGALFLLMGSGYMWIRNPHRGAAILFLCALWLTLFPGPFARLGARIVAAREEMVLGQVVTVITVIIIGVLGLFVFVFAR